MAETVVKNIPRIVIAGTHSGVGKTTIVAGLLAAFKERGLKVQSFKVGPDYIDPGFHKAASGRESYNLDTWLVPSEKLVPFFSKMADGMDLVIVEGVMGLYDGGKAGISSTAEIAKRLDAPVILIVDTRSMGESAAALIKGFKEYDQDVSFSGVILNRLGSANHENMIVEALQRLSIPVYGTIHRNDSMQSPERHLGLTPVTEFDPTEALEAIKNTVKKEVDLDAVEAVAKGAKPISFTVENDEKHDKVATIGVAYDEAFSFYYPASLEALEAAGAKLVYFSPLRDKELPPVNGLIFGGGFPEMFLDELSQNETMKEAIREAHKKGMPIYAECGGLMYLCEEIYHFDGSRYETCGLVPAVTRMQKKLQRVGYVTAKALRDSILCKKGDILKGHEFHFSTMEGDTGQFPWGFNLEGSRTGAYDGGYVSPEGNVLASYLHINFAGAEKAAKSFVMACADFAKRS